MSETKALHTLKVDPELSNLIPDLAEEDFQRLEESIKAEGCRDPLDLWGETIVDGHNRYDICHRNNVPFAVRRRDFEDKDAAKLWIINNQLSRRNLKPYQRTTLALKEKEILEKEAKARQGTRTDLVANNFRQNSDESSDANKRRTDQKLAEKAGVSRDTVRKVEKIEEEGDEETKRQAASDEISINEAYRRATKGRKPAGPKEEFTARRIKRVRDAWFITEDESGKTKTLTRSRLLKEHGFTKCEHCRGYGLIEKESGDGTKSVAVPLHDLDRAAALLRKHFDVAELCGQLKGGA